MVVILICLSSERYRLSKSDDGSSVNKARSFFISDTTNHRIIHLQKKEIKEKKNSKHIRPK